MAVVGPGQTAYAGLGAFANPLTPYINKVIQAATVDATGFASRAAADAMAALIRQTPGVVADHLLELARVLEAGLSPEQRQEIHHEVGLAGQASVLDSYDRHRRSGGASGYRAGRNTKWIRYSGGRLRAALADPSFFTATPEGLDFINIDLLNRRAAQWARLNFGAGAIGKGSHGTFPVTFDGLVVAALGLNENARPSFFIPTGYFVDSSGMPTAPSAEGGGVAFFPVGTGDKRFRGRRYLNAAGDRVAIPMIKRQMTKGIAAENFLDAGVARVAREIGPRYENFYKKLFEEGEAAIKPVPWTVKVLPGR